MEHFVSKYIRLFGSLAVVVIFAMSASAQFTITLPKLPKVAKAQPTESAKPSVKEETSTSSGQGKSSTTSEALNACSDHGVKGRIKDIDSTRAEAEEFRPGLLDYYVSTLSDRKNLYLEAALLPSQRATWQKDSWYHVDGSFNAPALFKNCIEPALDALAIAARKSLPNYTGPAGYTFGTPAEKQALLSTINDLAQAKVLKVGIKQQSWLIAKDDFNLPTARYKHGVIWAKYPKANHGFCWIFWVNVKQDYAGGGTYGDTYGYFVSRALAGCPAG